METMSSRTVDAAETEQALQDFARAFFRRDLEALSRCTTDAFEWRFAIGRDDPDGRIYRGVAGIETGYAERDALLQDVRYDDVSTTALADGRTLMEYRVTGRFVGGPAFDFRGVEIFVVDGGRVALKDVYWKQHPPKG